MDVIGPILVGIVLAIIHLVTLFVILGDIKRLIFCTNKVDATVKSVTEKVKKNKDSKEKYTYRVTFKYDYNGQTYESFHTYSNHCRYSKNSSIDVKINPHKPKECWVKDELKDLLGVLWKKFPN